jgi:hypothetical protein
MLVYRRYEAGSVQIITDSDPGGPKPYGQAYCKKVKMSAVVWSQAKKIYIERRPSFFAFAGIGTMMKKMRSIRR